MNGIIYKTVLLLILIPVFSAFLDPYADRVDRGNSLYNSKDYDGALESYSDAERYAPSEKERDKLAFNRGAAQYRAQQYSESIASFEKAIKSGDNEIQKKAFFNIGNAYLELGEYEKALESYINALKIDPEYQKAKKNIEYIFAEQEKKEDEKNEQRRSKNEQDQDQQDQQNQQNQQNQNDSSESDERQASEQKIDTTQIMNMLKSLKQRPVERKKGNAGMERHLEKDW